MYVCSSEEWTHERTIGSCRDWHIGYAEQCEHTSSILKRSGECGVASNGGDAKEVDLRTCNGNGDRHRIVVTRITVDDEWERLLARPHRSASNCWWERGRERKRIRLRCAHGSFAYVSTRRSAKRSRSMVSPTSAFGTRPSRTSRCCHASPMVRPRAGPLVASTSM